MQQVQPPEPKSNIKLSTKYKKEDIDFCEFLPDDRDSRYKFKFYCPICLRYFTHILSSECCKNQLCLFCVHDLQEQEIKNSNYKASCPYNCTAGDVFELSDVNQDDKGKRYSDSQYMSFYSNNKAVGLAGKSISS